MLISDGEGTGPAEHHQVQQRVGSQSVGAVDTGAGRLAAGVQAADHLVRSVLVCDDLEEDGLISVFVGERVNKERGRGCSLTRSAANLSLVVCGNATHVVVDGGQDGDRLLCDVDSGKDHGRLRDAGQPGGQLLGGQVVELQEHVVLLWTHTPEDMTIQKSYQLQLLL